MDGKTVVVTGATDGVGRVVAGAFADEGASVALGARDAGELEETVEKLEATGGTATGVRTDVRDEFDVERLMEIGSRFGDGGRIDVVVPAATVYHGEPGETPVGEESYASFDDTWRTNVRGVFATIVEALPHLTDGARILVPTGTVGREPEPGYGSYAISQAAVESVARGFAVDTGYAVARLESGRLATDPDAGRDSDEIAATFVRAASETEPAEIDDEVIEFEW